ncbi:hypothetical protein BJF93_04285 [Xaviernesmea oryzae]|uniref:Uncharacterized protein n=1 Tax=Xaviernesmea oryzae TaxID=464029 RepID=A0A1Q9AUK2_9HYPH|nr:hypothetical protein [Xaviernesmea oryzae]OLP59140.1 hypothetical protein BJF93_04285 [Xaviernesmea oryzae]SEK84910.1 hypothetical protein SAMN04487976_104185 [Xaviernesmea oryzae]
MVAVRQKTSKTARQWAARISGVLLLAALLGAPALAAPLEVPQVDQQDEIFRNLPGVKPQEPLNGPADQVTCTQVLQARRDTVFSSSNPRYDTVNVCRKGNGPEFTSPRLPPSIYRQLRGFNY